MLWRWFWLTAEGIYLRMPPTLLRKYLFHLHALKLRNIFSACLIFLFSYPDWASNDVKMSVLRTSFKWVTNQLPEFILAGNGLQVLIKMEVVQELTPSSPLASLCCDEYSYMIVRPLEWQLGFCSLSHCISYTVNTKYSLYVFVWVCVYEPMSTLNVCTC